MRPTDILKCIMYGEWYGHTPTDVNKLAFLYLSKNDKNYTSSLFIEYIHTCCMCMYTKLYHIIGNVLLHMHHMFTCLSDTMSECI